MEWKQPPPLRESRLTHVLASALGDSNSLVHALVYAPTQRRQMAEAAAAVEWAHKASLAKLKPGLYAGSHSKALITQLQGALAALDAPNEEMRLEMGADDARGAAARQAARGGAAAQAEHAEAKGEGAGGGATRWRLRRGCGGSARRPSRNEPRRQALFHLPLLIPGGARARLQEAMATLARSRRRRGLPKQAEQMRQRRGRRHLAQALAAGGALSGGSPRGRGWASRRSRTREEAQAGVLLFVSAIKLLQHGHGSSARSSALLGAGGPVH